MTGRLARWRYAADDQEPTLHVVEDILPARVHTPERRIARARVWVADGRVVVHEQSGKTTEVVADHPATVERDGRSWTITFDDGTVWTATKGSGCGCGSPLRKLKPRAYEAGSG